jgi:hypothetical protein
MMTAVLTREETKSRPQEEGVRPKLPLGIES